VADGNVNGEEAARLAAQLTNYRIEAQIGRGGMGVVYRAEQINLGRKVAVKVIAPQLAQEPAFRDRFRRESKLAAAIDHPNIIPVYEADTLGDLLFIAMRYVDGTDLRTIIQQSGGLQPRRAAQIVAQVAAALDAAHERDLVHRDVKPANVLLSGTPPHEHAYLTDFGLTKHMSSDSALTETGQWVGTLDFVAPEQIMGQQIDGRADVYSLGCVFFETLTGQPPFPRDVDIAKIYAHLNEPPPRVTEHLPELSPEFDSVVARALAKEPAQRYQSAGEFREAVLGLVSTTRPERSAAAAAAEPATPATRPESPSFATAARTRMDVAVSPPPLPPPPPLLPQPPRQDSRPRPVGLWIVAAVLLLVGAGAAIAAATGVFGGSSTGDGEKRSTAVPAAEATTPAKHKRKRNAPTVTVTTPAPAPGPVSPPSQSKLRFQTGTSSGRDEPATYCEVRPGSGESELYCWTPDDGFTVFLGRHAPRGPAGLAAGTLLDANRHRVPAGYSTLGIGERRSGSGFTCESEIGGLTCTNSTGHGWTIPRDTGALRPF
jgi:serine/threonine protein kinase